MSKNDPQSTAGGPAFAARFGGFILMVCAMVAFLAGARPSERGTAAPQTSVATRVGVGLGALGATGFVAGRALERRARVQEELKVEVQMARPGANRHVG